MQPHTATHRERQPVSGDEVVTSRYSGGGRGVILTALKQRSHSTSCRREVRLKLLDQEHVNTNSQDAMGVEAWSTSAPLMQSQLLDSTVRMVSGHAPSTPTTSGQLDCLKVTHLNTAVEVSSKQHLEPSGPVTMATPNQRPQQNGKTSPVQNKSSNVSGSAIRETERFSSGPLTSDTSANHSLLTTTKMNEILREMKHLKTDVKTLLRTQDSLMTTRPPLETLQNPTQPNSVQSQMIQYQPFVSSQDHNLSHQIQSKPNPVHSISWSEPVRKGPVVQSMLEEARKVLREVRRRREVLEENLAAVERAKNKEVLDCHLEALASNRDCSDKVQIKKTVDAWIKIASRDIQEAVAAGSSASLGRGRPVSALRQMRSTTADGRGGRGLRAGHRDVSVEPSRVPGELEEAESYLTHLYGHALYDSRRRTLKTTAYRKSHPRPMESMRGVKMKSCKTQTSLAPPLCSAPACPAFMMSAEPVDLTLTPGDSTPVPMVIPLGIRWIESLSVCVTEPQQEVTSSPALVSSCVVATHTQGEEQLDAGEAPLPAKEMKSEEEEGGKNNFCGTDFLSVVDVVQGEEGQEEGEGTVELVAGPSPPPVLYQGPIFPPQSFSSVPVRDQTSILDTGQHRDLLETQLVEWVEQQLMSRMISQMYHPPPSDPTQDISCDQSALEEQSSTSDIVGAAGGAALQVFVDLNMAVDPALIRQLVNEVLAEIVASMLGQKDFVDSEPEPQRSGPGADEEDEAILLVPTPKPTPPPSPTTAMRRTTPPTTPPPSKPTSPQRDQCPQPAPELMATPTPSPDPAPLAGCPTALYPPSHALTWGHGAELLLDEERPEERPEECVDTPTRPLVMSVAEEEPPLPSALSSPPFPQSASPPDSDLQPTLASSASESASSSSSEATETDAAMSEGRLLISLNQLTTITDDSTLCSLSSSLQELEDMDHDPPSEGQVRGHQLLLSLRRNRETQASWGQQDRDSQTTGPQRRSSSSIHSPGQVTAGVTQVSHCSVSMEPQVDPVLIKLSNRKKTEEEVKVRDSSNTDLL